MNVVLFDSLNSWGGLNFFYLGLKIQKQSLQCVVSCFLLTEFDKYGTDKINMESPQHSNSVELTISKESLATCE